MGGWGSELWDRAEVVVSRTLQQTEELGAGLPRFLKDRGEVEREYAKALRKLVAKYSGREGKREVEETSQSQGFRAVLQELGYQAGQHEVLAESFCTDLPAKVKARAKELTKEAERCKKEAKVLGCEQEVECRALERAGAKYCRAQGEWQAVLQGVRRAEEEGTVSRNEEEKLKSLAKSRQVQAEEYKARYAQQLVRANQRREQYYTVSLPGVMEALHGINLARGEAWQQALQSAVSAEESAAAILAKCREDMAAALEGVRPQHDTGLWVDRLKTGNVPPPEHQFEDLSSAPLPPSGKTRTLGRSKLPEGGEGGNLYPRKRELERKVAVVEEEVAKGQKEMAALQLMVATYRQNPSFGDATKFQGELEAAILRVQVLESDLHAHTQELVEVDRKLAQLRLSLPPAYSSNFSTPEHVRRESSLCSGSIASSSSLSVGQEARAPGSSSSNSISSEKDNDSLEEPLEFRARDTVDCSSSSDPLKAWGSLDLPPPPPAWAGADIRRVSALYPFQGEAECNLAMEAGEEFVIVEGDSEGWSKVQRLEGGQEEGYVPTTFLQQL